MTRYHSPSPWRRRTIITFALGLGAWACVTFHAAPMIGQAAYAQAPATGAPTTAVAPAPAIPAVVTTAAANTALAKDAAIEARDRAAADKDAAEASRDAANAGKAAADADAASAGKRKHGATVGVTMDDDSKRVHVSGFGASRDYDSFEDFADSTPWLAALVFLSVTLAFLVPLAVIALLIWYKMRKNRMLNDTMLKLAEKGVMPPVEAMSALGAETPPQQASPAAGALYAQARAIRDGRQWSDLRKGIILAALGLGFSAYSLFDAGEANGLGLVLLFLGCGYIVLWLMEDRRTAAQATRTGPGI